MNDIDDQHTDLPSLQPGGPHAVSGANPSAPSSDDGLLPAPEQEEQVTEIQIPEEAQDSDLIEKEWVERAKEIVEHTRDDPYEQQRALTIMKAEYMKKRYDKDLKTDNR